LMGRDSLHIHATSDEALELATFLTLYIFD
jgi:hypothetical protein